jgi:hypothetical protein
MTTVTIEGNLVFANDAGVRLMVAAGTGRNVLVKAGI